MAETEQGAERALEQHEVGHPVHHALHGAGHRPKEVLDALHAAGYRVVAHGHIVPVQEYPKRVDCDDGIERIVHSREEEHKHRKPGAAHHESKPGVAAAKPASHLDLGKTLAPHVAKPSA